MHKHRYYSIVYGIVYRVCVSPSHPKITLTPVLHIIRGRRSVSGRNTICHTLSPRNVCPTYELSLLANGSAGGACLASSFFWLFFAIA